MLILRPRQFVAVRKRRIQANSTGSSVGSPILRLCAGAMEYIYTAAPNRSLSKEDRRWVVIVIAVPVLGIGAAFAWLGLYWVLPFAGLEVLVLWMCFRLMALRDGDFERLSLDGTRLLLERSEGGKPYRLELNRFWTRARLQCAWGEHSCRLVLCSHGRDYEFGRHLSDAARRELARQLQARLQD